MYKICGGIALRHERLTREAKQKGLNVIADAYGQTRHEFEKGGNTHNKTPPGPQARFGPNMCDTFPAPLATLIWFPKEEVGNQTNPT